MGDVEQEDRGTTVWIWSGPESGRASFSRYPKAMERNEVSIPIGWHFAAHPTLGVRLASVFWEYRDADEVLFLARRGRDGFRLRRSD